MRCKPCLLSVCGTQEKRGRIPLASFTEAGVSSVYKLCAIVAVAENALVFRLWLRKCERMREALRAAVFM